MKQMVVFRKIEKKVQVRSVSKEKKTMLRALNASQETHNGNRENLCSYFTINIIV